ncbi:MAG: DUF1080 domain-containing protein [Candidatus Omnitrophica bacterium]|nr:DUF1080 domain-containing protein [Candidatus Omnitrophota bacterium]
MERKGSPTHLSRREFVLALSASCVTHRAGAAGGETTEVPKDFTSLFDGQSLAGWHPIGPGCMHGSGGKWTVEEGVLIGEQDPPGSGNGGLLVSDQSFGDFELLVDAKPDWGPDSGIFIRCGEEGSGFQIYVDYHDGGNVGHLRGEMPGAFAMKPFQIFPTRDVAGKITGFTTQPDSRAEKWPEGVYAYSCTPDEWLAAWRIDDWNTIRIRCVGAHPQITTWINGAKICTFNGETSPMPGYDKERVLKMLGRKGRIGLQVHGGLQAWPKGTVSRWRNISIKEL